MNAPSDFAFLSDDILSNPLFSELIKHEIIETSDIFWAYFLLKEYPSSVYPFLFLVFFSFISRNGHSCLFISENKYEPYHHLFSLSIIKKGFYELPDEIKKQFLHVELPFVFFKKVYNLEKKILENMMTLIKTIPNFLPLNLTYSSLLTKEQQKIMEGVLKNSLSFIYGGPGTGKTFLLIQIIKQYLKEFPKAHILVASPTGKSTSNIKEILSKNDVSEENQITVLTIHSLFSKKNQQPIQADLLIIDEASMISIDLFHLILYIVPKNKCLIIAGDPNQLPPIGIGNIFADLIEYFPNQSYKLTINQRTSSSNIQNLAEKVLNQEKIEIQQLPSLRQTINEISEKFINLGKNLEKFCVLTPLRRGVWGSKELNKIIRETIIEKTSDKECIPIMITDNLTRLNLYNGDVGILDPQTDEIFIRNNKIARSLIEGMFCWNYVTSVHKSQGSEYEEVLLLIPDGSEIFSSELIYTGITRAKKTINIWADSCTIETILNKKSRKQSGFLHKLYK